MSERNYSPRASLESGTRYYEASITDGDGPSAVAIIALVAIGILGLVLFFACVNRSGRIQVPIGSPEPLTLVGVPGDTIRLDLFKGKSFEGIWHSPDGVFLRLSNIEAEYNYTLEVLAPGKNEQCNDSDGCNDNFKVKGAFTVPEIPEHTSGFLAGNLLGSIRFQSADRREQVNVHLDVPVDLHLAVVGEGTSSGEKERNRAWDIFWIVIGAATVLSALATFLTWLHPNQLALDLPKHGNKPLALTGVAGDRIRLHLLERRSYGGVWGSDHGVRLALQDEVSGSSFNFRMIGERVPVVPQPTDDEEIGDKEFTLTKSFRVPRLRARSEAVLTGRLSGDIWYPSSSVSKTRHVIDLPVRLKIIAPGEGITSGKRGDLAWSIFWTAAVVAGALWVAEVVLLLT